MSENTQNIINSKILKSNDVIWRELKFIQQDDFKDWTDEDKQRLKNSLIGNQFIQPFYVWEDKDGCIYCLDGKHRTLLLEELISDGTTVPDLLPAIFIDCKDKQEAAKLVLVFSSAYAHITQQGLHDFINLNDLDWTALKEEIAIPEFSEERFEQKFNFFDISTEGDEDTVFGLSDIEIKVQPGDLFQLGDHRIICGSFQDIATIELLMDGQHIINRYVRWCNKNGLSVDFKHINGSLNLEDILEPTV